ncbi:pilus assembly protein PilW [Vibrio sp. B1FIG11]|nr:pilus assembly protein PilW [Vibrio sp. B1FIG11]CAE6887955.1 pilus assembly protein PilW [Vibrio sp. B1FIG11]
MFNQKGASLVEFMIASSLGLISLAIVGSLYISGQKVAMERSKELMLLQNTGSVLAMLRNDIQRAGFNESGSDSVKISGATDTIYTLDTPGMGLIAYAYQVGTSGAAPLYKSVVYEQRINTPESLFVCEKKQRRYGTSVKLLRFLAPVHVTLFLIKERFILTALILPLVR